MLCLPWRNLREAIKIILLTKPGEGFLMSNVSNAVFDIISFRF